MRLVTTMVLLVVVASGIGSALAEGAWVLWEHVTSTGQPAKWTVVKGAPSFKACETFRQTEWESGKRIIGDEGVRSIQGEELSVIAPSGVATRAWKCIPDTIDPREIKR